MANRVLYIKSISLSKPKGMSIQPIAIDTLENSFSSLLIEVLNKSSEITQNQERKRITPEDIKKGFELAIESESNNILIEQIKIDFKEILEKIQNKSTESQNQGGVINEQSNTTINSENYE
jgi:histone H3/H4